MLAGFAEEGVSGVGEGSLPPTLFRGQSERLGVLLLTQNRHEGGVGMWRGAGIGA